MKDYKEVDERFDIAFVDDKNKEIFAPCAEPNLIKAFIHSEIEQAEKELFGKLFNKIDIMKKSNSPNYRYGVLEEFKQALAEMEKEKSK
jgi:hypothetical protein